jgi:hypothetical protein
MRTPPAGAPVRSVINRDKLRHLGPLADLPTLRRLLRPAG